MRLAYPPGRSGNPARSAGAAGAGAGARPLALDHRRPDRHRARAGRPVLEPLRGVDVERVSGLELVAVAGHAHLQSALEHIDEDLVARRDRKSTRLNSSHLVRSYAVLCRHKSTTTT